MPNTIEPRLARIRAAAVRDIDDQLLSLSLRESTGPLASYALRDFCRTLATANRALSRLRSPLRTRDSAPPEGPEANRLLRAARAALVTPKRSRLTGRPRGKRPAESAPQQAPHEIYPRILQP